MAKVKIKNCRPGCTIDGIAFGEQGKLDEAAAKAHAKRGNVEILTTKKKGKKSAGKAEGDGS